MYASGLNYWGGGGGDEKSEEVALIYSQITKYEGGNREMHTRSNEKSIRKMEARKRWRIFVCTSERIRGGHGVVVLQISV